MRTNLWIEWILEPPRKQSVRVIQTVKFQLFWIHDCGRETCSCTAPWPAFIDFRVQYHCECMFSVILDSLFARAISREAIVCCYWSWILQAIDWWCGWWLDDWANKITIKLIMWETMFAPSCRNCVERHRLNGLSGFCSLYSHFNRHFELIRPFHVWRFGRRQFGRIRTIHSGRPTMTAHIQFWFSQFEFSTAQSHSDYWNICWLKSGDVSTTQS